MDQRSGLVVLLQDKRTNAVLAWALTAVVAATGVQWLLAGQFALATFALATVGIVAVPAVGYRDPDVMVPWEVVALVALPVVGRYVSELATRSEIPTYVAVAALALVVAVELDVFTPVTMPTWFAVFFVVIATMATAGVWAVVQWVSDLYVGTQFILDPSVPESTQESLLMWNFVAATVGGIGAGLLFEWYFRRLAAGAARLPDEVQEVVE